MQAYLVIREGGKWSDVFRLVPGQTATIGRAPTNQIIIRDERCSRTHAEVFLSQGQWVLRDLDSRNGTVVSGRSIKGDYALESGDVIRIGRSQLAFVHKLSQAFLDAATLPDEQTLGITDDSSVLAAHEPTTITHRRNRSRLLDHCGEEEDSVISRAGRAAAKLCRLALRLAQLTTQEEMAELALEGLFEGTRADAAAVLLRRRNAEGEAYGEDLEIAASRTTTDVRYHRVSPFLASTVLRENEAVLARNVADDSNVASRDSNGRIHATSVICAPIRHGAAVLGLLHLYSTAIDRPLDPDHLEFTLAVADALAVALQNLNRHEELAEDLNYVRHENLELRKRLGVQSEIVGNSDVVRQLTEQIACAAATRSTVLVRGESGVGKELVARAVHYSSPRRSGPFVCLNCAAISESLLESELFGHERGAFTGATDRKIGKFEQAHQGTLMLDEIGEMSPTLQAKFLRVLEGHPFERVGGSDPVKVDVRVIAATNRDLEKMVSEGRFRRDLYFRLRVLDVYVLPLRKRPEDIPVLAEHFLKQFCAETARRIRGFTDEAVAQMLSYRWPGNVRELRNVVERAVVLCRGDYIDVDDLMLSRLPTAGDTNEPVWGNGAATPMSLAEMERRHILATLESTGWNKSQAAQILGIERSTLDRKIRRYELEGHLTRRG